MTALDAAFPFDESDAVAGIEQDLHLDVPRPSEVFLEEEVRVPEVRERDATSRLERCREFGRSVDPRHPDAAAARRRLEEHRIPDFRRDAARLLLRKSDSRRGTRSPGELRRRMRLEPLGGRFRY